VSKIVVDSAMPPERSAAADTSAQERPQSLGDLRASDYPNLVALAGEIMNPSMDDCFRFGPKVILDGLERRLTTQ
jgi:hypothetical protein